MSTPVRNAGRCGAAGVPGAGAAGAGAWLGAPGGEAGLADSWAGAGFAGAGVCHASACDPTTATARTTKSLAPISPSRSVLPACLGASNRQPRLARRHGHLVRRNQRLRTAVDDLVLRL